MQRLRLWLIPVLALMGAPIGGQVAHAGAQDDAFANSLALRQEVERLARRIERQSDERQLLYQPLRLSSLPLTMLDAKRGVFLPAGPMRAQATLRVLHLWSHTCPPCIKELPLLRDLSVHLSGPAREIEFLFVNLDSDDVVPLLQFLAAQGKRLPQSAPVFGDGDKQLAARLYELFPRSIQPGLSHTALSAQSLPLPLTLVLDRNDYIRLAFLGSVDKRRGELVNGLERLLRMEKSPSPSAQTASSSGTAELLAGQHAAGPTH